MGADPLYKHVLRAKIDDRYQSIVVSANIEDCFVSYQVDGWEVAFHLSKTAPVCPLGYGKPKPQRLLGVGVSCFPILPKGPEGKNSHALFYPNISQFGRYS